MIELLIAADDAEQLQRDLLRGDTERCAILYAYQVVRNDGTVRLIVRDLIWPTDDDYARRGLSA